MANPRKFSEKIALHTQKQAEETAAFEQILREVQGVTSTTPQQVQQQQRDQSATARQPQPQLLNAINNAIFRGGSLPNVNQMAQQRGDRTPTRQFGQLSTSPRASQHKIGPIRGGQKARADAPYASPPSLSQLNTAVAGGASPTLCPTGSYGTNYLLPPSSENAWRRANSDSAINSINSLMIPSVVPDSSEESSNNSNDPRDSFVLTSPLQGAHHHHHPHGLHKGHDGSGVIPTTVGDGSLLEIPTSASTGSLPDLTTFQFQTPIQQPVEIEDPHNNTSPYSTSPLSMTYSHSPTSCSPHSQQQQPTVTGNMPQHQGQQQVVPQQQHQQQPQQVQQHQQQAPRSPIPIHQQQQHQQHQHPSQQQQHSPQQQQQHSPQQPQLSSSPQTHNQQQHSPNPLLDNPLSVNTSFQQNFTPNENMLTAYRCPPRPSPQNSPSPFRSPSPHDGQLSAPPSPSNQPQSADSFYLSQQANALQQHFEQISMVDGRPQRNTNNNGHWQQGGGMVNNSVYFYNSGQQQVGATAGVTTQQSPSHHQPQTPQTPSSIPDIIFTEFLGTDCTDPLEDFLTSEAAAAAFREGLGPIDTGDFQMLADPNMVPLDPEAEDTFRLDRQ